MRYTGPPLDPPAEYDPLEAFEENIPKGFNPVNVHNGMNAIFDLCDDDVFEALYAAVAWAGEVGMRDALIDQAMWKDIERDHDEAVSQFIKENYPWDTQ